MRVAAMIRDWLMLGALYVVAIAVIGLAMVTYL